MKRTTTPRALLCALVLCAGTAAQAQSLRLNGDVDGIGCANGEFALGVQTQGTTAGTWSQHTTVDIGGARCMDLISTAPVPDGTWTWVLGDGNDTGTQTHSFPLPPATPFTVTVTLRNATGQPVYRSTGVIEPGCENVDARTSSIENTPIDLPGPGVAPVPTLGHAGLALMAGLLGLLGWRTRRQP